MEKTNDYSAFAEFISPQNKIVIDKRTKVAVIYPRVSSKEQYDNNGSLEAQEKMCRNFAERMNIPIIAKFGGTYESAATEERKEFQRMMNFINHSKENIRYIIVSDVDRYSSTGPNAIFLAEQLRQKGIQILAVSNPIDTLNPLGAFQQNMQLLFANYDNQIRRERTIRGMKQKFEKGYIIGKAPKGYSQSRVNNEMIIAINPTGKAIAKAFKWKAEHKMSSAEIANRLQKTGVNIREKQLSRIFKMFSTADYFLILCLENKLLKANGLPSFQKRFF